MAASHQSLANWYLQMAQHLDAGIAAADALDLSNGPNRKGCIAMAEAIRSGGSWAQVVQSAGRWLPSVDRRLLIAAEDTARLPQTCARLSERHRRICDTQRAVILSLIYPVFVFHFAAFVLPLMQQLDYEAGLTAIHPGAIATQALLLIAPLWAVAALVLLMIKIESPVLPVLLGLIPLLRRYRKSQSLADFATTIGSFTETGISVPICWREAAAASRAQGLQRAYTQLLPVFEKGANPADSLDELGVFPQDFIAYYRTGVTTGQLDSSMLKIGEEYQGRANRALARAAVVYPTLVFIAVAGMVVYTVFKFYAGYLDMINHLF